jgi:hypothetical protein
MYGVFRTLHNMIRRVHNMYPHTIIYFVSCTLDLCSTYVASEMTNSNLFQKIQNFPKKPKFEAKICQKSQICPKSLILANFGKFGFLGFFRLFFEIFGLFGQFWLFWPILANFGFFGNFWISCSLHIGSNHVDVSAVSKLE